MPPRRCCYTVLVIGQVYSVQIHVHRHVRTPRLIFDRVYFRHENKRENRWVRMRTAGSKTAWDFDTNDIAKVYVVSIPANDDLALPRVFGIS